MNDLRIELDDCGSPINDYRLIYQIHNKLSFDYSTCIYSFNTTKATLGSSYQKLTFNDYAQLLEDEKAKLITIKIFKSSKSKVLVANNESSKNSVVKVQTKAREKRRSGNLTNKGT